MHVSALSTPWLQRPDYCSASADTFCFFLGRGLEAGFAGTLFSLSVPVPFRDVEPSNISFAIA